MQLFKVSTTFLLTLFCVSHAAIVSKTDVEKIVSRFVEAKAIQSGQVHSARPAVSRVEEINDDRLLAYAVHLQPAGFVIVSANRLLGPILAYSFRHGWRHDSNRAVIKLIIDDVRLREQALLSAGKVNTRPWPQHYQSVTKRAGNFQQWPPEGSTWTGGWMETTWHQKRPFNDFCPLDPVDGKRTIVGCVATAMAQIVNYHQSIGNLAFDADDAYETLIRKIRIDADSVRCDFPNFQSLNSFLREIEKKFLDNIPLNETDQAALCFACGILLRTEYVADNSAAILNDLPMAMKNRMDYQTADLLSESEKTFYDLLVENMKQGLPVPLTLLTHVIVADGYNTEGFFHLNFGWGNGNPDEITDCWYLIPAEMPDEYKRIYSAVFNIKPSLDAHTQISLSDTTIYFPGTLVNTPSQVQKCVLYNESKNAVNIDLISVSDAFQVGLCETEFGKSLGPMRLDADEEQSLFVRCLPDSFGRFEGRIEIIVSSKTRKRFEIIDLTGYGLFDQRTVVYEGAVSGQWTPSLSPYFICGNVHVQPGEQLKIEPGVQVIAGGQYKISVASSAQLLAKGTVTDSIYFSAENPLIGWAGFEFLASGIDDTLSYCVIQHGNAIHDNGGAFIIRDTAPVIVHSSIIHNAANRGAAFYCQKSTLRILDSRISNNQSQFGGAIYLRESELILERSLLCRNLANLSGGAIFSHLSAAHLVNVTMSRNAASKGGGVYFSGSNDFYIKNSIIEDNYAIYGLELFIESNLNLQFQYTNINTDKFNWVYAPRSVLVDKIIWGEGNIARPSAFVDPVEMNFTLQDDSPCIDAGDPNSLYNDIENPKNPGHALWPNKGTVRNDLGALGGGSCSWFTTDEAQEITLPKEFLLYQNYPNPFNASTTIAFELPSKNHVSVSIYNVIGKQVQRLVDGVLEAGVHTLHWDGRDFSGKEVGSGLYFYILQGDEFFDSKKMILVR